MMRLYRSTLKKYVRKRFQKAKTFSDERIHTKILLKKQLLKTISILIRKRHREKATYSFESLRFPYGKLTFLKAKPYVSRQGNIGLAHERYRV